MAKFLDLPREVRIQILSYAVGYRCKAGTEADTEAYIRAYRGSSVLNGKDDWSNDWSDFVRSKSLDASSIYLVNSQIRQEAQVAATIHRPVEFELDFVVWRQCETVVPIWIFISKRSDVVDVLKWTVRFQGKFQYDANKRDLQETRSPPPFTWMIDNIARNFLCYGPCVTLKPQQYRQHDYFVKRFVIDVQSPVLEKGVDWWNPPLTWLDESSELRGKTMTLHPEAMLRVLLRMMDSVWACDLYTVRHREYWYRYFGSIEIRKDGQIVKTYDLDAALSQHLTSLASPKYTVELRNSAKAAIYAVQRQWIPLLQEWRTFHRLGPNSQTTSVNEDALEIKEAPPSFDKMLGRYDMDAVFNDIIG